MAAPKLQLTPNSLYYGDCLDVMKDWHEEQFDFVYLDPPFNSKTNYNRLFGSQNGVPAQVLAFADTWTWNASAVERTQRIKRAVGNPAHAVTSGLHEILGNTGMVSYVTYMAERLAECRRMLKPTGSIVLHCDPHASHYLKIVMDSIFGGKNFLNEIIWYYRGAGIPKTAFARRHDVLLWYAKNEGDHYFDPDPVRQEYAEATKARFSHYIGNVRGDADYGEQTLNPDGKHPDDVITTIQPIAPSAKERLGYPTQKPVALMTWILEALTKQGDLVLDPFCGCGTTVVAAKNLGRDWVGIDISPFATQLVRDHRLKDPKMVIYGIPSDVAGARLMHQRNPFDFEAWVVSSIDGLAPNERKVGDRGIDGRGKMYTPPDGEEGLVLAQAKGGGYKATEFRDFMGTMNRENASAGVYITIDKVTNANALAEARDYGTYKVGASEYQRIQFWSVEEMFQNITPRLPAMADPYTGEARQSALPYDDPPS